MRSRTLIIGDERQEDFDRLAAGWRAEYGDEGQATESLLQRVILGDWFLQRAERRYMELECELAAFDSLDWTEEQHKQMELHLRYKTGAERSFYRALNSLRGLRKDKIREELDFETMRERAKEVIREVLPEVERERQEKTEAVDLPKRAQRAPGTLCELDAPVVETVAQGGRASEVFNGQNHPKKRLGVIEREAASGTGHVGPPGTVFRFANDQDVATMASGLRGQHVESAVDGVKEVRAEPLTRTSAEIPTITGIVR